MLNSHKVSFSLPKKDFLALEKVRRRLGIDRSTAIDMAIRFWLDWLQKEKKVRQYIAGYEKTPETVTEIDAITKAQLESLDPEEDWS